MDPNKIIDGFWMMVGIMVPFFSIALGIWLGAVFV
jgi:hypothetical protein